MSAAGELPAEGWYLMSTAELERWLRTWREGEAGRPTEVVRLETSEAIAYRNAGNLPDDHDRTLRLVLLVRDASDLAELGLKRLEYEPDYHEAPRWRRAGSAPVNVVPIRAWAASGSKVKPWWEEPRLAALEDEWRASGKIGDLVVPAEYRSFVYKTILALRDAGKPVTVQALVDSLARWLSPVQVEEVRRALVDANRDG